jgi:hypothetical protein
VKRREYHHVPSLENLTPMLGDARLPRNGLKCSVTEQENVIGSHDFDLLLEIDVGASSGLGPCRCPIRRRAAFGCIGDIAVLSTEACFLEQLIQQFTCWAYK